MVESTETATVGENKMPKKINGFFKIPKVDRDLVFKNLLCYCGNDPSKIDTRMCKTAFKATVDSPGCVIVDKPQVVSAQFGDILLIPIKNTPDPVAITVNYLRSALQQRMYL